MFLNIFKGCLELSFSRDARSFQHSQMAALLSRHQFGVYESTACQSPGRRTSCAYVIHVFGNSRASLSPLFLKRSIIFYIKISISSNIALGNDKRTAFVAKEIFSSIVFGNPIPRVIIRIIIEKQQKNYRTLEVTL